jgi:membrane protein implicated in regulation of membrane protease activity
MPRLSEYEAIINTNPELKSKRFKVKVVKTTASLLWIISILILIYQVQTNSFATMQVVWAASLILSIVMSSIARRMARKLILATEKKMPVKEQAVEKQENV